MDSEILLMLEEKEAYIKQVETLLRMDKRSGVDCLNYKVTVWESGKNSYDESITIVFTNGRTKRIFATGNSHSENLEAIIQEVYG